MNRRIKLIGYFIADHPIISGLALSILCGGGYLVYRIGRSIIVVLSAD